MFGNFKEKNRKNWLCIQFGKKKEEKQLLIEVSFTPQKILNLYLILHGW